MCEPGRGEAGEVEGRAERERGERKRQGGQRRKGCVEKKRGECRGRLKRTQVRGEPRGEIDVYTE